MRTDIDTKLDSPFEIDAENVLRVHIGKERLEGRRSFRFDPHDASAKGFDLAADEVTVHGKVRGTAAVLRP